jgi:hypothetical protein
MAASEFKFEEWAGSARGLCARPIRGQKTPIVAADVQSVRYESWDVDAKTLVASGPLTVADVMLAALAPWSYDDVGYTFLWEAPGTLWPVAGKSYRVIVYYTLTPLFNNNTFIRVWRVKTKGATP